MKTSILHLSDLHFVKNAAAYSTEEIILREAEEKVKDVPQGNKLLVVTGDFHNFDDADYSRAESFLKKLVEKMGLIMEQDVFVIPGNYDVGNDTALKPFLEPIDPLWKSHKKAALAMLKRGDKSYLLERLRVFRPYCTFVQRLGIYDSFLGEDYPAQTHVRSWRGRLNILHLNTALIADGKSKKNHQTDADGAANPDTWKDYYNEEIPSIALGHNSYYDLKENQRKDLAGTFALWNISVYLCGDRHRTEHDTEQNNITIEGGHKNEKRIPNMVAAKGIADGDDTYSEVGFGWHIWDEDTDDVSVELRKWTRDTLGKTVSGGDVDGYVMRRVNPDVSTDDSHKALCEYLSEVLNQKQNRHPSFQLLKADEIDSHLFPNVERYHEIPSRGRVRTDSSEQKSETCLVWDIVRDSWTKKEHRSVVITGEGGSGKTVTLFSLAKASSEIAFVPALYIPMYELVDKSNHLLGVTEYIKGQYGKYGDQIEDVAKSTWTERPQILVLLDGFNEIPFALRWDALDSINEWYDSHPGAQMIAVSRPMDYLSLNQELFGNPISITLTTLEDSLVRAYLRDAGRRIPSSSASIWENLRYPLFLNLYIKTGRLKGKTTAGYSLSVMESESGGALIWNFFQRELLRHKGDKTNKSEKWFIQAAFSNEYLLPYIAFKMVSANRMSVEHNDIAVWVEEILSAFAPEALPNHLQNIWTRYKEKHGFYPQISNISIESWCDFILKDSGSMVLSSRKHGENCEGLENAHYVFMHQNFRDCLAGIHLINHAEVIADGELPEIWQHGHSYQVLNYVAEMIESKTSKKLWKSVRNCIQGKYSWKYHSALYNYLEYISRNSREVETINLSGLDLQGVQLGHFLGKDSFLQTLFQNPAQTIGTWLDYRTFLSDAQFNSVTCLTILPNGQVVSGSEDGSIRIWDANSGECTALLKGHSSWVSCIAALPHNQIVSGSNDSCLRIWEVLSGNCLLTLSGHTAGILCVATLPDGRVISGSDDNTLRVWDSATGQCLQTLEGHRGRILCVAILPDGRAVSGSTDTTLRLWNITTGECMKILEGHSDWIKAVAILPDSRMVSASSDHTLRVWDIDTGDCNQIMPYFGMFRGLDVFSDGRIVSCADSMFSFMKAKEDICIWDPKTGALLQSIDANGQRIFCIATLTNGYIASGSHDGFVQIWDAALGECVHSASGHRGKIHHIAALPGGRIVSGSDDLRIWDAITGLCLHMMEGHKGSACCIAAISRNQFVSASFDDTLRIWDVLEKRHVKTLRGHTGRVNAVSCFPDGKIISCSDDYSIRVWDIEKGECIQVIIGHTGWVNCLAVLSASLVASGSSDQTVRVWDIVDGTCLQMLEGHEGKVTCLTTISDMHIISGSADTTLRVWDTATGECLHILKGHSDVVTCVSVLPNGQIVSGSEDGTLRIWDIAKEQCLHVLSADRAAFCCVAALQDGRLISGSVDNTLRLWDSSTGTSEVLRNAGSPIKCVAVFPDGRIIFGTMENEICLFNSENFKKQWSIYATEVDVSRMDFSKAILSDFCAYTLWYNGAKISDEDYINKVKPYREKDSASATLVL